VRYQISSAGNRLCVSYRNSRVWKKDSTLKWSSWNRSALFLSTSIPFSLVSRSSTPSCYFAYRKWRRLGLQSRKRRAIYLHKLHLQRQLVFSEKNLCDNALLGHAVAQQTTIISLFCRAITIQNKPGRPKTKYWRLLLMLVWKNKQQHKRELVLPCRGEGCSAGYSAPFNGSKGWKAGRYTKSHEVFELFLNPYQQVSNCKYLYNSDSRLKCNISEQSCQVIHLMYKNCLFCNNSMTTITNSNFEIKSAQPPLVLVFYTCLKYI